MSVTVYKFHDVQQNSTEWFDLRIGKVTASTFGTIMANYGKAFGEPAKKLALNKALEICTGKSQENVFSNQYTERGNELEPFARMAYEDTYFLSVDNPGFFDCGRYGASPDGLIGTDGAIEIKSVIPTTHYDTLCRNNFDPSYRWQLIGHLLCTEREWVDFVSYCPEFTDGKQLLVYRVNAKNYQQEIEQLSTRLSEFIGLIDSIILKIK